MTVKEQEWVDFLDRDLEQSPIFSGKVYRPLRFERIEDIARFALAHKEGKIVSYPAYTSTSLLSDYHQDGHLELQIESYNGKGLRKWNPNKKEVLFE